MSCQSCGFDGKETRIASLAFPPTLVARIEDLLRCNEYPFGPERGDLEHIVRTGRESSKALTERIAVMQKTLDTFKADVGVVDSLVKRIAPILHPVRGVPREILSEIFIALAQATPVPAYEELRQGTFEDSLLKTHPAWVVSKVSSEWRRAALATPQLWTQVALSFDEYPNSMSATFLLDRYLSRSANRPLSVYIFGSMDDTLESSRAFPTLLLTCHRWKSVNISIPVKGYRLFDSSPSPFRVLQEVLVDFQDAHLHLTGSPIMAFGDAPALRSIVTGDVSAFATRFGLPAKQILHYHALGGGALYTNNSMNLHVVQHLSSSLRSAQITLGAEEPATLSSFTAPELRTLKLRGPGQAIQDFCGKLAVPALETYHFFSNDKLSAVISPLAGSSLIMLHGQSVVDVSVTMHAGDVEDVIALKKMLGELSGLKRLEIYFEGCDISGACTELITTKERPVVPSLEVLRFACKYIHADDAAISLTETFTDMLTSRRSGIEGVQELKSLIVDYASGVMRDEVWEAFEAFRLNGLDGQIRFEPSPELGTWGDYDHLGFALLRDYPRLLQIQDARAKIQRREEVTPFDVGYETPEERDEHKEWSTANAKGPEVASEAASDNAPAKAEAGTAKWASTPESVEEHAAKYGCATPSNRPTPQNPPPIPVSVVANRY
ncbi:hypothetical protein BDZ89DRAFT_1036910 [Hymenopellis radicata]|nr:hypothetical protein BDZ89DRAFT_1036910 [Hymenopellis radicata]